MRARWKDVSTDPAFAVKHDHIVSKAEVESRACAQRPNSDDLTSCEMKGRSPRADCSKREGRHVAWNKVETTSVFGAEAS